MRQFRIPLIGALSVLVSATAARAKLSTAQVSRRVTDVSGAVLPGIVLQVAATPEINVTLAIGSVEETVSVEAAAPLVDVQSAGISEVVDNERILELPLQGVR